MHVRITTLMKPSFNASSKRDRLLDSDERDRDIPLQQCHFYMLWSSMVAKGIATILFIWRLHSYLHACPRTNSNIQNIYYCAASLQSCGYIRIRCPFILTHPQNKSRVINTWRMCTNGNYGIYFVFLCVCSGSLYYKINVPVGLL